MMRESRDVNQRRLRRQKKVGTSSGRQLMVGAAITLVGATVLPYLGIRLTAEFSFQRGNDLWAKTEFAAAQKAYQLTVRLNPHDARAYAKLSELHYEQGQFAAAIAAYTQAMALDPQIPIAIDIGHAYRQQAATLAQQGQIEAAITAYRQAIAQAPDHADGYLQLGALLEQQANWSAAQSLYQDALKQLPNQASLWTQLGVVLQQQGQTKQALKQYWQAVKVNPNYAPAYRHLGTTLHKRGKVIQAIAFWRQAIDIDPQDATTHQQLCFALHQRRQYAAAIRLCQKAIALDPTLGDAKIYLQEVQRQLALNQNPHSATLPESFADAKRGSQPLVKLKRSVVKVIARSPGKLGQGTGWLIKRQGTTAWIVTNRHVTNFGDRPRPKTQFAVEFFSQPQSGQVKLRRPAQLLQATSLGHWLDLAVLKVEQVPLDIQPLTLASTAKLPDGPIRTIGHPHNNIDWTVTSGDITRVAPQVLHLSAGVTSGNSGGPVLDDHGHVIGLVFGVQLSCDRIGLAWAELDFSLSCGVALPIEAVHAQLRQWQIL